MTALPLSERTTLRDDELLVLITQGDEQALGTLYARYGRLVYTIALRCTTDRLTAEEVIQDVFQHVWQHAGMCCTPARSVSDWMIEITL